MDTTLILLLLAIFAVAVMYSSVGHGGASGYLAVMAFMGVAPEVTRPTALVLNLFVASIGTYQFWRAGFFKWRVFWPFAMTSIPFAFYGGIVTLSPGAYTITLGGVLCIAALRLAIRLKSDDETRDPPFVPALIIGAAIGLLSGMVGVGGGIFLTPVLLLMRWAETKTAAAVSVVFILVNSIAGLLGNFLFGRGANIINVPSNVWLWIAAAVVGGLVGSTLGAKRFNSMTLRRVLATVLLLAAVKLIAG
jgi:uncharacterized membrane protein YfcA